MQYRLDNKTGNKLSVLGFGCMRFPRGVTGLIDMKKTEEMITSAVEKGVNYFDTAYLYPGSEDALGIILEKHKLRDKVFIASKLPLVTLKSAADFDKCFDVSARRLKVSTIDYYLLHMLTSVDHWNTLVSWGIKDWIAEKKKTGQIGQIGFSFHGAGTEFLKLLDLYPWEFCQIQYNYSDENFQAGTAGLKKAAGLGMPVVIMEPLLGGKLANALPDEAKAAFKKANSSLTPAQWALKWVWDHAEATVTLSGMNSAAQLEENAAIADICMPNSLLDTEKSAYKEVLAIFSKSCKIPCTGCGYCMPCPQGVNIPACFTAYNSRFAMGLYAGMQQYLTSIAATSEKYGSPRLCVKCGACEKHCPQSLPVMADLEAVKRTMEPWWFRTGIFIVRKFLGRGTKNV